MMGLKLDEGLVKMSVSLAGLSQLNDSFCFFFKRQTPQSNKAVQPHLKKKNKKLHCP